MENETITIELKRETAVLLVWLATGMFLVVVAFFLPGNSTDLWEPLAASGVAGAAYIGALVVYCTRPAVSTLRRWTTIGITAITLLAAGMGWAGQKERGQWQRESILSIRAQTSRAVLFDDMVHILKEPYEMFYSQRGPVRRSLGELFQMKYGEGRVGTNIFAARSKWDGLQVILTDLRDDRIVLVAWDSYSRGKSAEFTNLGGQRGKIQERFTLTEGGLSHEVEN
ncbi:MAG: hypothetical protein HYZ01_04275 [Ignavibacteriales bacterium]|nr:hypothetical protein [Ignavibacteriales bacterium]